MGHSYIGTEHILLGLIREGEGVAAQVLVKLGADFERVRDVVLRLLSGYEQPRTRATSVGRPQAPAWVGGAERATSPACPGCHSELTGNLRHSMIEVSGDPEPRPVVAVWCAICGTTLALLPPSS